MLNGKHKCLCTIDIYHKGHSESTTPIYLVLSSLLLLTELQQFAIKLKFLKIIIIKSTVIPTCSCFSLEISWHTYKPGTATPPASSLDNPSVRVWIDIQKWLSMRYPTRIPHSLEIKISETRAGWLLHPKLWDLIYPFYGQKIRSEEVFCSVPISHHPSIFSKTIFFSFLPLGLFLVKALRKRWDEGPRHALYSDLLEHMNRKEKVSAKQRVERDI